MDPSHAQIPFPRRAPWWLVPLCVFVGVAAAMLIHAATFSTFLSDDALISLRYARRLVQGKGLTWTDGERVEGYTDLLWILLTGAGGRLGFDYIATALALDRFGVLLALAVVGLSPRTGRWSAARLLVGGGFLAASAPMAVWSNGGLEHGFMTGVLALGSYLLQRAAIAAGPPRRAFLTGAPLAALALLRADGIVLVSFALLGALLAAPSGRRWATLPRLFMTGLPTAAAVAGQTVFRRVYYGQWQPNTAIAKLAFNRQRLVMGLRHLQSGYQAIAVLLALSFVATFFLVRRRARTVVTIPWCIVIGWTVYLGVVGGDIFPGWRQLLLVLPPLALIVAEAGEHWTEEADRWRLGVFAAVTLGFLGLHLRLQRNSENQRAKDEVWEWDGLGVGTLLKQAFASRQPVFAVDAAGALPYWSELPSLDMLGLNDFYIAHHPPPDFGHGPIGHELGDGAYVWRRAPDLISFVNAAGDHQPRFLSGRQLLALPEFHRRYQWIRVQATTGNRAVAEIWVRREGGKVGVVRERDRIEVPGYFITGQQSDAVARPDANGALVANVTDDRPGVLPALEIPAGRWRVTVSPSTTSSLLLDPRCGQRSMQRLDTATSAHPEVVLDLDRPEAIALAIASSGTEVTPTAIAALVFARATDRRPTHRCVPAGARLLSTAGQLSSPRRENLYWAHPGNIILGPEGVVIRVEGRQPLGRVDISADSNDSYTVEVSRAGHSLWKGVAGVRANGGGLARRRLDVSPPMTLEPLDELTVIPSGGDGSYSLGHLRIGE